MNGRCSPSPYKWRPVLQNHFKIDKPCRTGLAERPAPDDRESPDAYVRLLRGSRRVQPRGVRGRPPREVSPPSPSTSRSSAAATLARRRGSRARTPRLAALRSSSGTTRGLL